jgi:uncharacterized delta-60 repeat protein
MIKRLVLLTILFFSKLFVMAQGASLDSNFLMGTGFGIGGRIDCIDKDNLGNIYAGGSFTNYQGQTVSNFVKILPNGTIDQTFSSITPNADVFAVKVQPNGQILIGGNFSAVGGVQANKVARINANGTIDNTFCNNIGLGAALTIKCFELDAVGKIYVGGDFSSFNGLPYKGLARLLSNGIIDQTFAQSAFNDVVNTLKIDASGKLWVAGAFTSFNGTTQPCITRLTSTGAIDPTLTFNPGATIGTINSIALQTTGALIVGGNFTTFCGSPQKNVCRILNNGAIDGSFLNGNGTNGLVKVVLTYLDNKIFIGGGFTNYNSITRNYSARLMSDGSIDPSFDPMVGSNNAVHAAVIQADKKLVVVGKFTNYMGTNAGNIYRTEGSLTIANIPNKTICMNSTLALTATVSACSGTTLNYQWYYNNTLLNNATSANFVLSPTHPSNSGTYHCVVSSSSCGTVTSNPISVTINQTTSITAQPVSASVCANAAVNFSVTAIGANLNYVWSNATNTVGTNAPILSIPSAGTNLNGRVYRCAVSGSCGSMSSTGASLTVKANTVSVANPIVNFCSGATLTGISVSAGGYNPTFQWYLNNVAIPGATTNSYSKTGATASDAGSYKCVVISSCGTATSQIVSANLNQTPVITSQPNNVISCQSGAGFLIGVSGGGINYKWYKNGVLAYNGSAPTYTPQTMASSNGNYYCVCTNACGTVTSNTVTYTLSDPVIITQQPISTEFCMTASGSLSVTASGPNSLSYQWYQGLNLISGATANTYNYSNITQTTNFKCVVTNGCFTATSTPATITITQPLSFTPKTIGSAYPTLTTVVTTTVGTAEVDCALSLEDGRTIFGGVFREVNGVAKKDIASIDITTGNIDNTFNIGPGSGSAVYELVKQPNGQVLVGGTFQGINGVYEANLQRLNNNGSIDATFAANNGTGPNAALGAIAVQDDGKILIGGWFSSFNGVSRNGIARLNADGTLDQSFGYNGSGISGNWVNKILVQKDDKIIIIGFFNYVNGVYKRGVARLNPDGTLDPTFNPGGVGTYDNLMGGEIQPDGKILIGGYITNYNGAAVGRIARLNTDGTLDNTFNTGGSGAGGIVARQMSIQSDGKIIICGFFTSYNGVQRKYLARLNPDGTLDQTFNGNPVGGANNDVYCTTINPDNSIMAFGKFSEFGGVFHSRVVKLYNEMNVYPQNPTICSGNVIKLYVPNMDQDITKMVWRLNGDIVATGVLTYTAAATTANGGVYTVALENFCGSIPLGTTNVTVVSSGAISNQPSNINACQGNAASLTIGTSGYVSGYQWFKNGVPVLGATQASLSFSSIQASNAGTYKCKVFTACGAIYSASSLVSVAVCSGNGDNGAQTGRLASTNNDSETIAMQAVKFNVFPNPNNGLITIESETNQNLTAHILNLHGQVLAKKEFNSSTVWDIKELKSGMYVLQLIDINGTAISTKRIVVE